MKLVIITGTPGTGKTTISNRLYGEIDAKVISLNKVVVLKDFIIDYDEKRDTNIIDMKKLLPYIIKKIELFKENEIPYLIIESHFADIVPNNYIDMVIIFRCHPDELLKRLNKRKYSQQKIYENIQSEILANSVNYMIEKNLNCPIYEIDTSNISIKETTHLTIKMITSEDYLNDYELGKIDWLSVLDKEEKIQKYFFD